MERLMNVKELIAILQKEVKPCDRENAEIEIFCDKQQYEIKEMSGFSFSSDIVIKLKPVKTSIMKPMIFKKKHKKMVSKIEKKIFRG
jgi:hypothetical protein